MVSVTAAVIDYTVLSGVVERIVGDHALPPPCVGHRLSVCQDPYLAWVKRSIVDERFVKLAARMRPLDHGYAPPRVALLQSGIGNAKVEYAESNANKT